MPDKPQLTLLQGGRDKQAKVNSLVLKTIPDTSSPLPADVRLFEEDTYLVLTVDPVMRYTEEHPIRLMTKVTEAKPNKPGSIVINDTSWYAVVHDLDNDPTCSVEWVKTAYNKALTLAEIKRVRRIAMPLLGTVHGRLVHQTSLELLVTAIKTNSFVHLQKILLLVPQQQLEHIRQWLQKVSE